MTSTTPRVTAFPMERTPGRPFDPPAELATIRDQHPLVRMTYPDGHDGWLATGHPEVRAILGDRRFSSRYEIAHFPMPGAPPQMPPAPVGDLTGLDAPEHTRYRKQLMGYFTARRMRTLTERVADFTTGRLDAMERSGLSADLVPAFARPVPALVICELLGVPYGDRAEFQRHVDTLMDRDSMEGSGAAWQALQEYLHGLVLAKRAEPADDVLSALTASDLTDEELAGIGAFLLGAGLDTTANMLALGTFALFTHPQQMAALRADPDLTDGAVEELMRFLSVADPGLRTALEDVELGGQCIRAGESVTLSMAAANRDPRVFPDPDTLDIRRENAGQLAFGHGIHLCLGAQLARVEMRVAFPTLLARFPDLSLACTPEDVPMRVNTNIYGVQALPVAW